MSETHKSVPKSPTCGPGAHSDLFSPMSVKIPQSIFRGASESSHTGHAAFEGKVSLPQLSHPTGPSHLDPDLRHRMEMSIDVTWVGLDWTGLDWTPGV